MDLTYIKNKKIVLTGASGFLGKKVTKKLVELLPDASKLVSLNSKDYDLRLIGQAFDMVETHHPEVIINLAARLGGIGDNRNFPASYFYDNLMIGINMIEAARIFGVDKLINIGTVCSYPKNAPVPFREENLWDGFPEETNGAYGISKRSNMVYSQAVFKQYGFKTINLVLTNLYGPGDDFRDATSHVIPAIIKKIVSAKEEKATSITAWGDGSPSRDFLFVEDAAEAVIKAAEYGNDPEPINIGSGQEVKIRYLIEQIARLLEYEGEIRWDTSKPNGQPKRYLDTSRAKERIYFEAQTSFDQGLNKVIEYYLTNRTHIDKEGEKFKDFSPFDDLSRNT